MNQNWRQPALPLNSTGRCCKKKEGYSQQIGSDGRGSLSRRGIGAPSESFWGLKSGIRFLRGHPVRGKQVQQKTQRRSVFTSAMVTSPGNAGRRRSSNVSCLVVGTSVDGRDDADASQAERRGRQTHGPRPLLISLQLPSRAQRFGPYDGTLVS